jgi:hypothetical protein
VEGMLEGAGAGDAKVVKTASSLTKSTIRIALTVIVDTLEVPVVVKGTSTGTEPEHEYAELLPVPKVIVLEQYPARVSG